MQEESFVGNSFGRNRRKFGFSGVQMFSANDARHGKTCGESEGETTVIGEGFREGTGKMVA